MRAPKKNVPNSISIGIATVFILFSYLLGVPTVFAAVDPGSFVDVGTTFTSFAAELNQLIPNIINDPELSNIPDMFWQGFSVLLIINLAIAFHQRGLMMEEIFGTILLIGITRVLMIYFDDITSAIWGWSEGFATGIQRVAVGNTDLYFIPRFTYDLYNAISFSNISFLDGVSAVVSLVIMNIVGILLSVLALLATTWAMWGYALAKMVGWMFVPMVMFKRLSWLFDGWLRFFFGFLIYGVVARANLVLVAIVLKAYFDLPSYSVPAGQAFFFSVDYLADTFGLLSFMLIGVFALVSTGQFAASIAGGVGGFGSAVRNVAFGAVGLGKLGR